MLYGFGFDKIDTKRLERLKSPVLVIAGGEDTGTTQAAINFLSSTKEAKRLCEMLIYPGADHGYAQPLFNEERITTPRPSALHGCSWKIFLATHYREARSQAKL